ncbi:MAG: hypothetical protein MJ096_04385 [Clostridia bacterium]|nr:hypothetical protein [Clostridia bacterium]
MKKILAIVLMLVLVLSLAACGKGEDAGTDNGGKETEEVKEEMKGEVNTWGKISVFVPEGFTFGQGSITGVDDTDETQCYLKGGDQYDMYHYFWIVVTEEESAKSNVDMTKSVNEAEDITIKADNEWTGCHYVYSTAFNGDLDCGMVYRVIDGAAYQVSFCGYATDSAEMTAVLNSIAAAK